MKNLKIDEIIFTLIKDGMHSLNELINDERNNNEQKKIYLGMIFKEAFKFL